MTTSQNIIKNIGDIVSSYVNSPSCYISQHIYNSLSNLLEKNYRTYNFATDKSSTEIANVQNALFSVNEKTESRKANGVYYTPEDVCKYIILNSIIMLIDNNNQRTYKEQDAIDTILEYPQSVIESLLFQKKFFDPTCGSGEFLLNCFRIKHAILEQTKPNYTDSDVYNIAKTIYGNDIDDKSTDISKIRLFFEISQYIKNTRYIGLLAKALNSQFYNIDYVVYDGTYNNNFDCVIGNPPYVEYGKFENKDNLQNSYGNIYADVIKNSLNSLKKGGTLGFVIPLSYISTSRMSSIRNYVIENTNTQFILNFGDRPDCLFTGVHQKLNILIARKGRQEHRLYTSNYKHWYKDERKVLLNGCEIKENHHQTDMFIPKIGNQIEENIYRKVSTSTKENIFETQITDGKSLYLNMRACFWIKAFSFNPGSNEYKKLTYMPDQVSFVNCVLNSSLFWLYWTIMSDCWHITTKELKGFLIPELTSEQYLLFDRLSQNLEEKLENTKKYIGTKQADYEYKHKECKNEIDAIDNLLASIYDLTNDELSYIKSFALKYRMGSGADDKDN